MGGYKRLLNKFGHNKNCRNVFFLHYLQLWGDCFIHEKSFLLFVSKPSRCSKWKLISCENLKMLKSVGENR